MEPKQFYFSFTGRINRAAYWLRYVIPASIVSIIVYIIFLSASADTFIGPVLLLIWGIVHIWIGLAVGVKRYHDRGKSGWWVLIALIPLIGTIWQFVELGFLKGTDGPNNYGPDPLRNED